MANASKKSRSVRATFDAVDLDNEGSPRSGFDAVTALTVYLIFLLLIPSDLVVPGLGNLGAPAILWGFVCLLWWTWHSLTRRERFSRWSPVEVAVIVLFAAVLLSYIFAMLRPIPGDEVLPADRGLLRMLSFLGVTLVAATGIPNFARLFALLRRFAGITGVVAFLGIIEFALATPITRMLTIPGLVSSGYIGTEVRGGYLRPSATAIHPLEYATMLSVAFPVALILAMRTRGKSRYLMLASAGAIGLALVLAGSRSAILGLVVGVIPLVLVLGARERILAATGGALTVVAIYVLVPGMLGTLRYMFATAGEDSSIISRTESFGVFELMLPVSPWVGRGLGTFLPSYRIFDNQLLNLVLELGIIGTVAFLALYGCAIWCALTCRTAPPIIAGAAIALAASCVVAVMLSAFFDSFSFPKAFGVLALLPGLCGACWMLNMRLREDSRSLRYHVA